MSVDKRIFFDLLMLLFPVAGIRSILLIIYLYNARFRPKSRSCTMVSASATEFQTLFTYTMQEFDPKAAHLQWSVLQLLGSQHYLLIQCKSSTQKLLMYNGQCFSY